MKYLKYVSLAIKSVALIVLAAALGYVLGDEIEQRKLRAELRAVCFEQTAAQFGGEVDELGELVINYQCRNAIP